MTLTISSIVVTIIAATVVGGISISNIGNNSSKELLYLLCENGQKNINSYLNGVEKSVDSLSKGIEYDLNNTKRESGLNDTSLAEHLERADASFYEAAIATNGVFTYYYRIDPSVSTTNVGFWYQSSDNQNENRYVAKTVTNLNESIDPNDESMFWYSKPKSTGQHWWLDPYNSKNNEEFYVISYNTPIYCDNQFIGVVGIEIEFATIEEQVNNISIYDGNGYAFINDTSGLIIYHPKFNALAMPKDQRPEAPKGLVNPKTSFVKYTYEGKQKQGATLPLANGMRLNVAIPMSVINAGWQRLILEMVIIAFVVLTAFIIVTIFFTRHFTKPLQQLTVAAEEINKGNYDVSLDYKGNDEMGLLTTTVNRLVDHLKGYISDLNSLAYADALTSVRNKSAYDLFERELQERIDKGDKNLHFAIAMLDCDDLKVINDTHGHDKGDVYLKNSSHLILRVFQHSPVFRVGGDEFVVILQNEDYNNSERLRKHFIEKSAEISSFSKKPWEKICVAVGIATYDPRIDKTVEDVLRRADHLMYENKRERKKEN